MNRIIIIGNGFDLAHGLKTSYGDFLDWVKSQAVKNPDEYFEYILIPQVDVCFGTNKPKASSFFNRYYNGSKKLDEFISEFRNCKFIYRNKFLEHLIKTQSLEN
jgi:hypothetical protein